MKNNRRQSLYALLAAIIWGAAFSAQSMCAQYLGPFTITALRSIIAFLVLLIVCLLRRRTEVGSRRDIIVGSLICGAALFAAANLQQLAINMGASAGKAGFVTALYIVLVPIGQMFFKHSLPSRHWIAVAVAVTGMYFLCITDGFSISSTDLILLMCAFLFTIQILSVDRFSFRVDGLVLSCGMFLVVAVLSALVALPFEEISVSAPQLLVKLHRPLPVMRTFRPGREFFSIMRTLSPLLRANPAAQSPAAPPPMIITSYFILF